LDTAEPAPSLAITDAPADTGADDGRVFLARVAAKLGLEPADVLALAEYPRCIRVVTRDGRKLEVVR
jgi:hypothetical protein